MQQSVCLLAIMCVLVLINGYTCLSCESVNSCGECTKVLGCGWCNGRCQSGTRTTQCPTPWMYSHCTLSPEIHHEYLSAADCVNAHLPDGTKLGGWCDVTSSCYRGVDTVSDTVGYCPTTSWYYFTPPESPSMPPRFPGIAALVATLPLAAICVCSCGWFCTMYICLTVGTSAARLGKRYKRTGKVETVTCS